MVARRVTPVMKILEDTQPLPVVFDFFAPTHLSLPPKSRNHHF